MTPVAPFDSRWARDNWNEQLVQSFRQKFRENFPDRLLVNDFPPHSSTKTIYYSLSHNTFPIFIIIIRIIFVTFINLKTKCPPSSFLKPRQTEHVSDPMRIIFFHRRWKDRCTISRGYWFGNAVHYTVAQHLHTKGKFRSLPALLETLQTRRIRRSFHVVPSGDVSSRGNNERRNLLDLTSRETFHRPVHSLLPSAVPSNFQENDTPFHPPPTRLPTTISPRRFDSAPRTR